MADKNSIMPSSIRRTKALAFIALFAVVTAICSWISIPTTVPFTLQTFAIDTVLLLLGGRKGTASIGIYLLLGAIGVPVFASFSAGLGILLGATGGYLMGFLAMGLLYWGITKVAGNSFPVSLVALILGTLVLYAFGTFWFVQVYAAGGTAVTYHQALLWCVIPFLPADGVKLVLAVIVSRKLRPHLHLDD